MSLVFIGLGSNLAGPVLQLCQAIAEIKAFPKLQNIHTSSLYRSAPVGVHDQPDFINAVLSATVSVPPYALLAMLQALEQAHGRQRGPERWGPRTLDLDILLYANLCRDDPVLRLPHPEIAARAFVLLPLYELSPDLEIPGVGFVRERVQHCQDAGIVRLGHHQ